MWHSGEGMGWWMVWGGIMMVLFWGVIVALVVWLVQSATRREAGAPPPASGTRTGAAPPDPLDIAKERFARGEITREQFEEIRRTLQT